MTRNKKIDKNEAVLAVNGLLGKGRAESLGLSRAHFLFYSRLSSRFLLFALRPSFFSLPCLFLVPSCFTQRSRPGRTVLCRHRFMLKMFADRLKGMHARPDWRLWVITRPMLRKATRALASPVQALLTRFIVSASMPCRWWCQTSISRPRRCRRM